jgi:AraC-like DNA-binding protein
MEVLADWDELFRIVPELPPSGVVLIDCTADHPHPPVPSPAWDLLTAYPSVAMVAAVDARKVEPATLGELVQGGFADVLDLSLEEDSALAARRLSEAYGRPFKRWVEEGLNRYPSARARTIIRAAAHVAVTGGGAPKLAAQFGVTPETIAQWCADAALPPPRGLQAWVRILLAALLLQEQPRTVSAVAFGCGYSSDRALRRAMNRFLGYDTRTLRRQGAFSVVMEAFNAELAQTRERKRAGASKRAS